MVGRKKKNMVFLEVLASTMRERRKENSMRAQIINSKISII
jgi:hypothetical protein